MFATYLAWKREETKSTGKVRRNIKLLKFKNTDDSQAASSGLVQAQSKAPGKFVKKGKKGGGRGRNQWKPA